MRIPYEELEVIGATTVADEGDLPRRLSPIYRRRGDDETLCLPLDEESDALPRLATEDRSYLAELIERGQAILFEHPFSARSAHCPLQLAPGVLPEYLPVDELPVRLRRACDEALQRAARALDEGKRKEAIESAWYARRADGDDPLPLLALLAMLRDSMDPNEIRFLDRDLTEYSRSSVEGARHRAKGRQEYAALGRLLSVNAPKAPDYLNRYSANRGFLPRARSRWSVGSPSAHAP